MMKKRYATSSRSLAAVALTVGCAALLAAGCAANPTNARLESARSALEAARADTVLAATSPVEYNRATAAFDRAEKSWRSGADEAEVDHQAFLAQRQIELATTTGSRRQVERSIEQTSRERDEIRLQASRREADAAQSQAQTAQSQLQTAEARAADAQSKAAESQARADALAQRLESLEAKPTDRGLVVTFSDVLFDTGQAELRPAAAARISQLAQVMKEYPERSALIEGFTDSTGSFETNQELSERRAMSVRREMIDQGIAPNRLVTQGHANRFPLADNTSASGRQQNRRVEVVLSNPKGDLPVRR